MYRQVDGVAMGSALGVTFANCYMAHIENTVISDLIVKPKLYARYVDDCFLVMEDEQHLELVMVRIFACFFTICIRMYEY